MNDLINWPQNPKLAALPQVWAVFLFNTAYPPMYIDQADDIDSAKAKAADFVESSLDHKPLKGGHWKEQCRGVTAKTYTQPILLTSPTPRKRFEILVIRQESKLFVGALEAFSERHQSTGE